VNCIRLSPIIPDQAWDSRGIPGELHRFECGEGPVDASGMNDDGTRFAARMVAWSLTAIATGVLMAAISSERAALVAAVVACVAALAGWECWRSNARRRR
jgi:hypothetical protein